MGWTISLMFPVDGHLDRKCFILLILGIPAKPVATYTNIALHWDTSCSGTWVDLHTFSWFPSWWACGKLQKKRRWTKLCRWEAGKRPKDVPDPMPPPISGPTHPLPEECPPSTHPSSGPTAPPSCQFLPNLPPPNTHFTPKKLSLRLSCPKVLGFIHFSTWGWISNWKCLAFSWGTVAATRRIQEEEPRWEANIFLFANH